MERLSSAPLAARRPLSAPQLVLSVEPLAEAPRALLALLAERPRGPVQVQPGRLVLRELPAQRGVLLEQLVLLELVLVLLALQQRPPQQRLPPLRLRLPLPPPRPQPLLLQPLLPLLPPQSPPLSHPLLASVGQPPRPYPQSLYRLLRRRLRSRPPASLRPRRQRPSLRSPQVQSPPSRRLRPPG